MASKVALLCFQMVLNLQHLQRAVASRDVSCTRSSSTSCSASIQTFEKKHPMPTPPGDWNSGEKLVYPIATMKKTWFKWDGTSAGKRKVVGYDKGQGPMNSMRVVSTSEGLVYPSKYGKVLRVALTLWHAEKGGAKEVVWYQPKDLAETPAQVVARNQGCGILPDAAWQKYADVANASAPANTFPLRACVAHNEPFIQGNLHEPTDPELNGMACPGTKTSQKHAYAKVIANAGVPCKAVREEITWRAGTLKGWHDPCNMFEDQTVHTYKPLSSPESSDKILIERITPRFKFTDLIQFTLVDQESGCRIEGCSESQGISGGDFNTNYCNIRNLYCGSNDGCSPVEHNFETVEVNAFSSCGQRDWGPATCLKFKEVPKAA